jgi:hypothetical protein
VGGPERNDPRRAPARVWAWTAALAVGLVLGLFVFYFGIYRARGYRLPVGFDAPWYIWRARYVGARGLGPLDTDVRPGHSLLASIIGRVTGLSQVELGVLLPLVLVGVFALALGAFWVCGFDRSGRRFEAVIPVALAGTLLGATRLIGENVANLLILVLVVGALVPLARRVEGTRGFVAAVALLIAAGLAHWVFLAVFGAVLLGAAILALPSSLADHRRGMPPLQTETGTVTAAVGAVALGMGVAIAVVLRAPFQTFEIREDPKRFLPKLRNDLSRLYLPATAPASAAGALALLRPRAGSEMGRGGGGRRRAFARRVIFAWTLVTAAGMAYGAITLDLPPHRFLALLVAVPGTVALTAAVLWFMGWASGRVGAPAAWALAAVAVIALAFPGWEGWYHHGPGLWIDRAGLMQTVTASAYLEMPGVEGRPVVFLVDPHGPAGIISAALKERLIRMGLAPEQEEAVHVYVGDPANLLAGRPTLTPNAALNVAIQPYWQDVRSVLGAKPTVLIVEAFARKEYAQATQVMGALEISPGVALLRGTPPATPLAPGALPSAVPPTRLAVAWAGAILALLALAGLGWTRLVLGPDAEPSVFVGMAPAVGTAALILGGLVAAELGVRLGGPGGVATFGVITVLGIGAALWDVARAPRRAGSGRPPVA